MEKYIKLFERLGINEKIARVYLDLLEYGSSSIADITKRTTLHRVEIYRALPFLEEEKLIIWVQRGKRTLYRALSPERLEIMIRDFEKRNTPLVEELMNKYEKLGKNISVTYQEGESGVTRVFDDIVDTLPRGAMFYRISAENDVDKANTYLPKDYRTRRDAKSLERYVIMGSRAAKSKKPRLERELVVIPENMDEFDENVTMTIYGDKVAYIDFTNEASIIIENPMIAKFQKKLFLLVHKYLKK